MRDEGGLVISFALKKMSNLREPEVLQAFVREAASLITDLPDEILEGGVSIEFMKDPTQ